MRNLLDKITGKKKEVVLELQNENQKEYETIEEFCSRTKAPLSTAATLASQRRIPGAVKKPAEIDSGYGKKRVCEKWFFIKGSWPDLNKIPSNSRIIPKWLRNHPDLRGWITTREYARKHNLADNYAYLIVSGRTRSRKPPVKWVGNTLFIPENWTHDNLGRKPGEVAQESMQRKYQEVLDQGYITFGEASKITGFSTELIKEICDNNGYDYIVYKKTFLPQDSPILKPLFYYDNSRGRRYSKQANKEMYKMYKNGMSSKEIAEKLGLKQRVVQDRIAKHKKQYV